MNVIDKKRALQGLSYGFTVTGTISEIQIDALMAMRDLARKSGLLLTADNYGRVIVKRSDDRRQIAIGLCI